MNAGQLTLLHFALSIGRGWIQCDRQSAAYRLGQVLYHICIESIYRIQGVQAINIEMSSFARILFCHCLKRAVPASRACAEMEGVIHYNEAIR